MDYWRKNLDEILKCPKGCHSWKSKKRDNFFKRMETSMESNNAQQCKSFDQRMKKKYFYDQISPMDIWQATIKNLAHLKD